MSILTHRLALMHKSNEGWISPFPGGTYPTGSVTGITSVTPGRRVALSPLRNVLTPGQVQRFVRLRPKGREQPTANIEASRGQWRLPHSFVLRLSRQALEGKCSRTLLRKLVAHGRLFGLRWVQPGFWKTDQALFRKLIQAAERTRTVAANDHTSGTMARTATSSRTAKTNAR